MSIDEAIEEFLIYCSSVRGFSKNTLSAYSSTGIAGLLKKNKVEIIDGFAKFLDSKNE